MISSKVRRTEDASPHPGENAAQFRNRIDRGETGDKVAFPDPAAAPLGTDEEAAGTSSISAFGRPTSSNVRPTSQGGKTTGGTVLMALFLAAAFTAIALIVGMSV
jgi:hypothetical protein